MDIRNGVVLITYPDSLGGNLTALQDTLAKHFEGAFSGLHILPFFPSTGDRGFAPIDYETVSPAFGSWDAIRKLSQKYAVLCDLMVNHISSKSNLFLDYQAKGASSPYAPMFIDFDAFWGEDFEKSEEYRLLYRRKDAHPFVTVQLGDGTTKRLWNTFRDTQLDIDVNQDVTNTYLRETIDGLIERGIQGIRLDAVGYITKIKGTSCFCIEPQMWDFLKEYNRYITDKNALMFTEIHDRWEMSKKLEQHGIWTYDFVLPFLMIASIVRQDATKLAEWLRIAPRRQFTVLDTHDGIGVYDAEGWVDREEAEEVIAQIEPKLSYSFKEIDPEKKRYWKSYQLYGTYYSVLGEDEQRYLCARAIQMFAPGVPMVYYVGLLAAANDLGGLYHSDDHRDINRENFTTDAIEAQMQRSVARRLLALLRFRNQCTAFQGEIQVEQPARHSLIITWTNGAEQAVLTCDLRTCAFSIRHARDYRQGVWESLRV